MTKFGATGTVTKKGHKHEGELIAVAEETKKTYVVRLMERRDCVLPRIKKEFVTLDGGDMGPNFDPYNDGIVKMGTC